MSLLNDLLVSMGRHRSATAAIFGLDVERGELEAVSAGHLPALLVDPDGEPCFLEQRQGLPLGIRTCGDYVCERYAFPIGSVLLLYTDGLVERRGEAIDRGLVRLQMAAKRAAVYRGCFIRRSHLSLDAGPPLQRGRHRHRGSRVPATRATLEMTLDANPTCWRRCDARSRVGSPPRALARTSSSISRSRRPRRRRTHRARLRRAGGDVHGELRARRSGCARYGSRRGPLAVRTVWARSRAGDNACPDGLRRIASTTDGTTVTVTKRLPGRQPMIGVDLEQINQVPIARRGETSTLQTRTVCAPN